METNNETLFNKLSSFSSRASKIPQRIAQSSLFSLRPSISSTHESRSQPTKTEKPYYSLPKTGRKLRTTLDFSRLDQKQTFHDNLTSYNSSNSSVSSLSNESNSLVYTISEWIELIEEKRLILLIQPDTFLTKEIIKDTKILLNACEIEQTLDFIDTSTNTSLVKKIREICQNCANHSLISYCIESENFEKETTKILKQEYQLELDPRIKEASWFGQYFIGNPYITLIGPLEDDSQGIITILQQGNQYRIIIRGKGTRYFLVSEQKIAKEVNELKVKRLFFKKEVGFIESALLSVCPHLDLRSFKELSAEFTRLAGLERDLLRYDSLAVPEHYKFGLLNIKNEQTTEKAWMRNIGLSKNLLDFLNIMGHKISLKGYKGYAGGLDKRVNEAGESTFVSNWKEHEIVFHVGPMMPLKKNDEQQVQRKRYIGNDIVSIIFIEEDQAFDPRAILSNFVFVFIVIHPELNQGKRQWRVEVIKNKKIDSFDPPLPSPPLFNDQDLKSFLTLKMIHAESASLKSERLSTPNNKARLGLLNDYIKSALSEYQTKVEKKKQRQRSLDHKSRLLQKAMKNDVNQHMNDLSPTRSNSTRSILGFSRRKGKEPSKLSTTQQGIDIKIGQNIELSTESFISTEQLFGNNVIQS